MLNIIAVKGTCLCLSCYVDHMIPKGAGQGSVGLVHCDRCLGQRRIQRDAQQMFDARTSCFSIQVGYTVRFEDVTSEDTRIKFLTDGMLLREAISDSLLRKYSCIILDEAHERTIHTDVLFGVVKAAQKRRKELGKLPLKVCAANLRKQACFFPMCFLASEL